jgi:hypothetical protein
MAPFGMRKATATTSRSPIPATGTTSPFGIKNLIFLNLRPFPDVITVTVRAAEVTG